MKNFEEEGVKLLFTPVTDISFDEFLTHFYFSNYGHTFNKHAIEDGAKQIYLEKPVFFYIFFLKKAHKPTTIGKYSK